MWFGSSTRSPGPWRLTASGCSPFRHPCCANTWFAAFSSPLDTFHVRRAARRVFKRSNPLGWRRNCLLRRWSRIGTARSLEAADCAHGHVVVTDNLTRQPDAAQASRGEPLLLCGGPVCRLSRDEL